MSFLQQINYKVTFKNVKNINIRINDSLVKVSAPHGTPIRQIEDLLIKNQKFIEKSLLKMQERNSNVIPIHLKTTIYILGRNLQFEVVKDTKYSYSLSNEKLTIYYKNLERDYEATLRDIAFKIFNNYSAEISTEMDLPFIEVEVKKFKACFGKNYGSKRIALNYLLVHMEEKYIKHVIYHEYTHCIEMNHSRNFYEILKQYDRNYRENKRYIENNLKKFC